MQEWLDKYKEVPRLQTCASIDKPMILFVGLTLTDFVMGVSVFICVVMFWDSGWSILCAIFGGLAASFCAKFYRNHFPLMGLSHFNWSLGIQKFKCIPSFFHSRHFRIFEP